jgi:hypothetical protein
LLIVTGEAAAGPRLETILRAATQEHGGEMLSITPARAAVAKGATVVQATVHLSMREESLGALVRSLEIGPPAVFFDHLRIARPAQEGDGEARMLDVVASVAAYYETSPTERRP